MSEFTAPEVQNNLTNTRLLANITDSSVMLQMHPNAILEVSQLPNITHFPANEIKFYNDVVVNDIASPLYNKETIDSYISVGILSDTVFKPIGPSASFGGVAGSSHAISNSLQKTTHQSKSDHLELFYSTDVNNKLRILVYRDTTGFSYSLDNGNSVQVIPSVGLLYPKEVTSIGIQNYSSVDLTGSIKIWAGTLREGLKSYTIGSTSWYSESNLEKTTDSLDPASIGYAAAKLEGEFLFKVNILNRQRAPQFDNAIPAIPGYIEAVESDGKRYQYREDFGGLAYKYLISSDGLEYHYFPGEFVPTYILGIVNNPINAGLPMVVYTRGLTTDGTTLSDSPRLLTKYLIKQANKYTLDSIYSVYRSELENLYPNYVSEPVWTVTSNPITKGIFDVLKTVQYNTSQEITSQSSGVVTALAVSSYPYDSFSTELLNLSVANHVDSIPRSLTLTKDSTIDNTISIKPNNFSGLSTYDSTIFITEKTTIWRFFNGVWSNWLVVDDTHEEKNTRIDPSYKFTIIGSTSYISGLRGFGVLKGDTKNSYIGILNTDFGHLTFNLVSTTDDWMAPVTGQKKIHKELFSTSVRDFQIIPEINTAISCGLITELVTVYKISTTSFGNPIRTITVSPKTSTNISTYLSQNIKEVFYKNYTHGGGVPVLHNKDNIYTITGFNNDQLYLTTTISNTVLLFKELFDTLSYVDGRSFDWHIIEYTQDSRIALVNYLTAATKYNRMKLLLAATETVTIGDYVLDTQVELPLALEFDYQIPLALG